MKKFVVITDRRSEQPDCFIVDGKSIDDKETREKIARYITQIRDDMFADDLSNMDEDEANEESHRTEIYELACEHSSKELFMDAWRLVKKDQEDYKELMKKQREDQERLEYEALKKKFGEK